MKKIVIAVITLMAVMINANAQILSQNWGAGFSGQAFIGQKNLAGQFNASYEMGMYPFGMEANLYMGCQDPIIDVIWSDDSNNIINTWGRDLSFYAGVDVFAKINFCGFQVLGGVGYVYALPSKSLQPKEGRVITDATYDRMESGFKASAGIAYSFGSNTFIGNRFDIKLLCNFLPFNNSGQMARKVGIELGITIYNNLR